MTYFPLRQTTCFFIPLVAPCKPLLLKAYEKLDTLKKEKFFRIWITRILINECNGIIRKRKNIISVTTCYPVRRSWPTIRTCMPFTLPTTDAVLIPL